MALDIFLDEGVRSFMQEHERAEVAALALKKPPCEDWPYPLILDQIKVRQKARFKTPVLCDTKGFVFPSSHLYEQASSESCAAYKANITRGCGDCFVDLTAGCGVDSFALVKNFRRGSLVEKNLDYARVLEHNADVLARGCEAFGSVQVWQGEAQAYVYEMVKEGRRADLVFVDPQRRDNDVSGRKGFFDFGTCSPNVLKLLPDLARVSKCVLIKAAPFLDIDKALEQLRSSVGRDCRIDVHVLQWRGECKEVLYFLRFSGSSGKDREIITAVDLDDAGDVQCEVSFSRTMERDALVTYAFPEVGDYIYEPGPAFQKAGGYKYLSQEFNMAKLHANTHLYISHSRNHYFPGKGYRVSGVFPLKLKSLPVNKADVAVRNFPLGVSALKKRLKIEDGGVYRLYACTTHDNKCTLVLCDK
ncbi:MAG: THUMP-like domain-containing protein [Alphaproteobacteria bacterium]